ncbi:ATP-binding protein [Ruegeria arenilitoris]|uniref:ATP-binding protein n=1 Tax=Ruegeria arenilitoris TaxID=1173585 RepID=UPI00147CA3BB|nr:ATP-binding protein [Ruegeria arenilitoris]
MSDNLELSFNPSGQWRVGHRRVASLAVFAIVLSALPVLNLVPPQWQTGVIVVAASILSPAIFFKARAWIHWHAEKKVRAVLRAFVERENEACMVANAEGEVLVSNPEATDRFNAVIGSQLESCLRSLIANPAATLLRLQSRANAKGKASDEVVLDGHVVPVSASRLSEDVYFWRIGMAALPRWQNIDLPILSIGRKDRVVNVNFAAEQFLGRKPNTLAEVVSQNTCNNGCQCLVDTTQGKRLVVTTTINRDGGERDLLLLPVNSPSNYQASSSIAALPVPMMSLSPNGDILEINSLASRLIGEVEPGTTKFTDIMQGLAHPIADWLSRTAEEDLPPHSEILRLTQNDKDIFVQVTLSRIIRAGRVCLIAVLNDATELKTLEAQFVQGQKMQAVGQLAGGVAHDFNNLLTAISGHCDLLLLRHDQRDPDYGDLVQINQNANRAAALVSQLLAFSRKQNLRPEVLDMRDTISDLIYLLNRLVGEKVRLVLSHDPVLKPVRADKRQLEQVLMNLVVNARDAMPEGGEIRIETEVLSVDQPIARDRATVPIGEYVTVKVIDSGVGIPGDKLQKVFEPFYTTKRTGEGTGLGLSTVYGIVKQTGGFIFVDSIEGSGSEFTVFLPVSAHTEIPEPKVTINLADQNPRQGDGVVLLVEDEAPVRAFATRALRLKGYTVLEAGSGEEALRLLEDENLTVDVFVTDVVMPGMDGPTWVRKALKTRPDVHVIFVSGYTEGAFGKAGPDITNSTFLPKPFSLTQLTEAVFQNIN